MNRVFWIDLIRVVSAFFVIMIHVSGRVAGGYDNSGDTLSWLVSRGYHQLSLVAVPLFIMVSGTLLLGRNEEVLPFYRKRFGKILLPFLAWCYIYILCRWLNGQGLEDGTPITWMSSIGAVLSANINGHFWFMYMLISLYLIAPFLMAYIRGASENNQRAFLILWFFACTIYPIIDRAASAIWDINHIYFKFRLISYWIGLFVAGYVLRNYVISAKKLVIFLATYFIVSLTEPFNIYFLQTHTDPLVVKICAFLRDYVFSILSHQLTKTLLFFFVFRTLGESSKLANSSLGRMISFIAPLTFGIYLSHMLFVIPLMKKIPWTGTNHSSILTLILVPVVTLFVYAISMVLIYFIRKIPYLKSISP